MQNLGSFRPLGAILGAPSHTKLDFAIPLLGENGEGAQEYKIAQNYDPLFDCKG